MVKVPLGDRSYDILIEPGLFDRVHDDRVLPVAGRGLAVVTSETLSPLGGKLCSSLKGRGIVPALVTIPDGEECKSMETALAVVDRLLDHGLDRSSMLIALGGGVVGDLTGFVASIYMRGIDFVMIPTTLLAQVYDAVGGKVAVNHPRAKNLLGSFHQPRRVLIDPNLLLTLPDREWRSGLAEIIKYGVIAEEGLFVLLEREQAAVAAHRPNIIADLVERSCALKAGIVADDERDEGRRAHLNFGHTVGHALEACAYGRLTHGEAVGLGMIAASSIAHALGMFSIAEANRVRALIGAFGLPVKWEEANVDQAWSALTLDKKNLGGRIRMVLPRRLGAVEVVDPVPPDLIREAIQDLAS